MILEVFIYLLAIQFQQEEQGEKFQVFFDILSIPKNGVTFFKFKVIDL